MSGLAGLWNLDGQPADRKILESIAAAIAHRGRDHFGIWSQGPAGLACQLLRVTPESAGECQPAIDGPGHVLVFDGRLDNREELLATMTATGLTPASPDSSLVLAAWREWGDGFLRRLQGDFALALFDGRRQALLLARDPVGCRPLYYWSGDRTLVFASEIKAIVAHPDVQTKPNEDLLADFFLLERLPYDDEGATFFDGIQAIRPGHWLRVSPGQRTSGAFWDFDPMRQTRYRSYAGYAEELRALLIQAVKRRMRSRHPVAVATSGGLDSSIVLCIADDLRRSGAVEVSLLPLSYAPGDDPSTEENQFIALLESTRGLRVERLAMGQPGGTDQLARAAWHSEWPQFDDGWCAQEPMLAAANAAGARVLLTGLWSDQLFFVMGYLSDLVAKLAWRQAGRHLREYRRWFPDSDAAYFRSRFRRELILNLTPDALRAWLHPLAAALARPRSRPLVSGAFAARIARPRTRLHRPAPASAHARDIYQAVRAQSRRLQFEADGKLAASYAIEPVTPFLDRDVIAYLMSIPGDIQTRDGVPRALLRDAMQGIVPEAILWRRWRDEGTSSTALSLRRQRAWLSTPASFDAGHALGFFSQTRQIDADTLEFAGLEFWSRVFFSGKLTAPEAASNGACKAYENDIRDQGPQRREAAVFQTEADHSR
jgi:asparagine synthase (glutamine-hydrolysing)